MTLCPLSNEPCNNPKTESIVENINGEKSQINLCKACCNSYLKTNYFKDEFIEFHKKDRELEERNQQEINQSKIREINFIENESNIFKKAFSYIKNKLNKKEDIKLTPNNPQIEMLINLDMMKNLYYRIKDDQKINFDNQQIEDAHKKQTILDQIKKDLKVIKQLNKAIIIAATDDPKKIPNIKSDIDLILGKYADLYKSLFD